MAKAPKDDDPTQDPTFKRVVRHFLTKKPEHKTGKDETHSKAPPSGNKPKRATKE